MLPSTDVSRSVGSAWKGVIIKGATSVFQPSLEAGASRLEQLELDGPARLLLHDGSSCPHPAPADEFANPNPRDVAAAQLVIDGEVEQRPGAQPSLSPARTVSPIPAAASARVSLPPCVRHSKAAALGLLGRTPNAPFCPPLGRIGRWGGLAACAPAGGDLDLTRRAKGAGLGGFLPVRLRFGTNWRRTFGSKPGSAESETVAWGVQRRRADVRRVVDISQTISEAGRPLCCQQSVVDSWRPVRIAGNPNRRKTHTEPEFVTPTQDR